MGNQLRCILRRYGFCPEQRRVFALLVAALVAACAGCTTTAKRSASTRRKAISFFLRCARATL